MLVDESGRDGRWGRVVRRTAGGLACAGVLALVGCKAPQQPTVETVPPPPAQFGYEEPTPAGSDTFAAEPVFMQVGGPVDGRVDAPIAGTGGTYTVVKGDTLWSIATKVYGDGQRHQDIAAANPGVNPARLLVGQTLVMP